MPFTVNVPGERAAPAVLDRVAKFIHASRFAHDAVIDQLVAGFERLHHTDRAVDGYAFLIRCDQQRNRAAVVGVCRDKRFDCGNERRQRSFHVGRSPAVEPAIRIAGMNGSLSHLSSGPVGTTSVWPAKHSSGADAPAPRP